jgi:hypothetical protein
MFEQREPEPAASAARPARGHAWRPAATPLESGDPEPTTADRYVAIDRIDDDVVTLAVAPWPIVDPDTGRLLFLPRDERTSVATPLDAVRERIDADRRASGQLIRPLRVGDVFWVRGYGERPDRWERVIDVTRAGRFAAKAALLATAAGAPAVEDSHAYGLDEADPVDTAPRPAAAPGEEPPQPPGPVAFPAV